MSLRKEKEIEKCWSSFQKVLKKLEISQWLFPVAVYAMIETIVWEKLLDLIFGPSSNFDITTSLIIEYKNIRIWWRHESWNAFLFSNVSEFRNAGVANNFRATTFLFRTPYFCWSDLKRFTFTFKAIWQMVEKLKVSQRHSEGKVRSINSS